MFAPGATPTGAASNPVRMYPTVNAATVHSGAARPVTNASAVSAVICRQAIISSVLKCCTGEGEESEIALGWGTVFLHSRERDVAPDFHAW